MDGERERELQEVRQKLQRALRMVEEEQRRLRAPEDHVMNIWWVRLLWHVLVIFTAWLAYNWRP